MTIPAHPFQNTKKQSGSAILWALIWLAGTAALAYFCLIRHVPTLELATEGRISQVLSAASATGIAASVNGYTASLTGTAKNETQKQEFLALAAGTPGVRSVIDGINLSDAAVATAAVATVDDNTPIVGKPNKLNLDSGNTESESPTAETTAETAIVATTDPITRGSSDASSITEIAKIEETEKSAAKTAMAEAAKATEAAAAAQSAVEIAASSTTPEPVELETIENTQTLQIITATIDPSLTLAVEDGTLMLDGQVAKTDNLNLLIDQAKASLNVDFVSNSTQSKDDTKPATWIEPITALIPAMAPLETPGISIEKNQITLQGLASDQDVHDAVITRALQLLGDYSLIERIDITTAEIAVVEQATATEENNVAEPAADTVADAQAKTSTEQASTDNTSADPGTNIRNAFELLPSSRILFRSGSAILTTESQEVLDTIAQLLREYPDAKMDIDGHTDSQGDSTVNLRLSQSRANAVRDYLVDQGISVYRLTAYGFGEGMPIAKNDSPEGRALNRRIEFKF